VFLPGLPANEEVSRDGLLCEERKRKPSRRRAAATAEERFGTLSKVKQDKPEKNCTSWLARFPAAGLDQFVHSLPQGK
jgi:hypothetical protein